jgi:hypothetical protein
MYRILAGKREGKRQLERLRRRCEHTKNNLKNIISERGLD